MNPITALFNWLTHALALLTTCHQRLWRICLIITKGKTTVIFHYNYFNHTDNLQFKCWCIPSIVKFNLLPFWSDKDHIVFMTEEGILILCFISLLPVRLGGASCIFLPYEILSLKGFALQKMHIQKTNRLWVYCSFMAKKIIVFSN